MMTVLWNFQGFHVVTMLPPRTSFNASWFIDVNLVPLLENFFLAWWSAGQRKLIVHIDNACAPNSRITQNFLGYNPLKRFPHLSYPPDISPLDFCLFGKVKSALIEWETPDEMDVLEAVAGILDGISDVALPRVFRSWIECLEWAIDARRNYLTD
jgi:hypothetical protein